MAGEGRQRRGTLAKLRRAIVRTGGWKTEGKRAGEDPHPKAELRWQLAVAAERRGGGCNGDQNPASMAAAARASRVRGSSCGFDWF
jgi:hypothetical protein